MSKKLRKKVVDKQSSHVKNVLHGFFLSIGTTVAEPSTILPLIINHFSGSSIVVGIFASLLKGGAIFVQMIAAFYAQSYKYMMPYLRIVFLVRFLSWFGIGIGISFFGESNPELTLWLIGIFLFLFSFSAGFGAIYFKDIQGKIFTHQFRGKSMAYRQFFSGLGAILSGTTAGIFLQNFEPPESFANLFMVSAIIMGFGLVAFGTIEEPEKENVKQREGTFGKFLKESLLYFHKSDVLKYQVLSYLFSYSHLIGLPFIIIQAEESIGLNGYQVGILLSVQMFGAMLSNIIWGKLSLGGKDKNVAFISFSLMIISFILSIFFQNLYIYGVIFFLIGASIDGTRLAFGNLILVIAPEEKRPLYIALQANISSFGLFFPILGGVLLSISNYQIAYSVSIIGIIFAFYLLWKESKLQFN
jgi:MFS family permease